MLPLFYAFDGRTIDGKLITDRTWIFQHAADYLGTEKPLVMMGNYEANTGFFPLKWKRAMNPFVHLCDDNGIEKQPPKIDLAEYERETAVKIDYVILLCLDSNSINHPDTKNLFDQLQQGYTKSHTSQYGRAILYKRNDITR